MPPTPPSLVRFAANAASVMRGASISRPTSDHVPALMKTDPGCRKGTPATAEPVSWVAAATTTASRRPESSITASLSGASRVPGRTTSGSSRAGTSRRSSRSVAQLPACGSKHCVVVAFVNSEVDTPQSQ